MIDEIVIMIRKSIYLKFLVVYMWNVSYHSFFWRKFFDKTKVPRQRGINDITELC